MKMVDVLTVSADSERNQCPDKVQVFNGEE